MDVDAVFEDLLSRVHEHVHGIPEGLSPEDLMAVPEPDANPIGWLLWHVTRVQDVYTAELTESDQVWMAGDWASRFGLTAEPHDVGYGHTPEQVRAVDRRVPRRSSSTTTLSTRTRAYLTTLTPGTRSDRIVDHSWDPPVTLGVRLVSILDDHIQHGPGRLGEGPPRASLRSVRRACAGRRPPRRPATNGPARVSELPCSTA